MKKLLVPLLLLIVLLTVGERASLNRLHSPGSPSLQHRSDLWLQSHDIRPVFLLQNGCKAQPILVLGEKMKNNKLLMSILVLLWLLLAACRSTSSGEAKFPTGKFVRSDNENRAFIFNEDRTWIVLEGSSTLVRATYSVDGKVFTETSNNGGCETNVDFTYTFDGTNLTFNYVGNPDDDRGCGGRWADMNDLTYVLSK